MASERALLRAGAVAIVLLGVVAGGVPLLVGPPGGDDAYYHAMYAQQHASCWRHGVVHPRWYPGLNDGLGGPEPRSRPLAALVVQAALALALDDAVAATSLATVLIPPAAGLLMLAAARRRGAGAGAALLAGATWAVAPYLLISLHQRAALQEAAALALLPMALAWLLPTESRERRSLLPGALALAALLATQLLVAFMAGLVAVAAWAATRPRQLVRPVAAVAGALGLAAFSWLPNVVSLRRIQGDVFASGWFDWRRRFLLAGDGPDPALGGHMQLALGGLLAACIVLIAVERGAARRLAVAAVAAALLSTPLSRWLWEAMPGLGMIQFPWRWLGPAGCLAVLGIAASRRPWARGGAVALLLAPALAVPWLDWRLPGGAHLRPSDPAPVAAAAATRYGVPPILPSFPATLPRGVDLRAALARGAAARAALPKPLAAGPVEWRWSITAPTAASVTLPLLVDPAWRATVDGRSAAVRSDGGLVAVEIAAGSHEVALRQAVLWEEWVAAAISLVTAVAIAVWARRRRRASPGNARALPGRRWRRDAPTRSQSPPR